MTHYWDEKTWRIEGRQNEGPDGILTVRIMRNRVFSRGNVFVQFKSRILDGDRSSDFAARKMNLGMTHADKPENSHYQERNYVTVHE